MKLKPQDIVLLLKNRQTCRLAHRAQCSRDFACPTPWYFLPSPIGHLNLRTFASACLLTGSVSSLDCSRPRLYSRRSGSFLLRIAHRCPDSSLGGLLSRMARQSFVRHRSLFSSASLLQS